MEAKIFYRNGTTWYTIPMIYNLETGYWEGEIPPMPANSTITFKIYAKDKYGNENWSQEYRYDALPLPSQHKPISPFTYFSSYTTIFILSAILGVAIVVCYLGVRKYLKSSKPKKNIIWQQNNPIFKY